MWDTKEIANLQFLYIYKVPTLPRGNSIRPSLLKAIEESQIAVVIFSENYADSSWCLDELACIMKCKKTKGQIVMPIFYDVDPSEVRKQKRKYGEAFDNHELENKKKIKSWRQAFVDDPWGWLSAPREQSRKYHEALAKHELENNKKVESWRKALVGASNISGWDPKHVANGHEAKVIKEIVDQISHSLKLVIPSTNGNLIGITARVQDLKSELRIGSGGVHMVGIWGVGGGGKTTLASSVYDEISRKFDGCCFVQNIREESSKNGLERLQEKIIYGILKQKQVQVGRVEEEKRMIMSRLCHRKVLIVLDDVDCIEKLKALAGLHDWFGEGSRIIITTRDEHLLNIHKVDVIHEITLLKNVEAMALFCKHAPRGDKRIEDYELLSKEVVNYAGGLLLALTVLGCFLCDKGINEWRSALARLKKIPDTNIVEKLKISFDGLTKDEKELFLDIACFLRGSCRYTYEERMMMLDACGFHPVIGIKVLVQKALITITEDGEFDMHDLVQEMAHYIVRRKHPKNPEKHSRVWKVEDVLKRCSMDNLDTIEAIGVSCFWSVESQHVLQVAANMKKLRWIDLSQKYVSKKLLVVTPLSLVIMPKSFPPGDLCCLTLKNINANQLWDGCKKNHRRPAAITPICCSTMPASFDHSTGNHQYSLHSQIPYSFYRTVDEDTKFLRWLAAGWELPNLLELDLEGNGFVRLDFSLLLLPRLKRLNVSWCKELVELTKLPSSIAVIIAGWCYSLERFGDISNCKWLWQVSVWGYTLCGDILLNSMLQGNAKDYFISINLSGVDIWRRESILWVEWVKTYNMLLPHDWYDHFSGILMFVKPDVIFEGFPDITIKLGVRKIFQSELGQESNETLETHYDQIFVGYVSFSSLRHARCLNSTYNMILFSCNEDFYGNGHRFRVVLVPRDDQVQTPKVPRDCSEFWDGEFDYRKTFIIQHDSNSSIKILWKCRF
ncbi:hypothetical protein Lser_V15G37388 [Lactuca serriola]